MGKKKWKRLPPALREPVDKRRESIKELLLKWDAPALSRGK